MANNLKNINQGKSWIEVPENSDFPLQNIPFGIIAPENKTPRPATRVGDTIIDLSELADFGFFDQLGIDDLTAFYSPVLNDFIALGKKYTVPVRERLIELFSEGNTELQNQKDLLETAFYTAGSVEVLLPVDIGDYTDFYSSIEHAANVGKMFRDPENALLPNWKHLPVGYHGRSSSIVVSGTNIVRPKGQIKLPEQENPVFEATQKLDYELEMAFITGKENTLGQPIPIEETSKYIFGMVIFNDLSARDIQKWEYVPLGPFLGKNFGSVISPWIVTMEALEPFRIAGPEQKPEVLPYLRLSGKNNFDIKLQVSIIPENGLENIVCRSNTKYLYWSMNQQLAHHTVNGCNIRPGDMYASGTISGKDESSFGSLLELSWGGKKPVSLKGGVSRTFIEDNDTIVMRAHAEKDGLRIGFGEVKTKILPAVKY